MEGMIDFHALEKELQEAVAADEKYQRENDAKFRAVRQKVASYEEFRDIVLASHLKPLEKKDKIGNKTKVLWNSCARKASHRQESKVELPQELQQLPKTSSEFYRNWRRYMKNSQEQYQFLLQLGSQKLGHIFQADLAFGLLGEFLTVLSENVSLKDQDSVLEILESLSGTKRFGLNVELLSKHEKESCRHLFEKLQRVETGSVCSSEFVHASAEENTTVTKPSCQRGGSAERKRVELMDLYQVL
ncbi:coiled-coil domain-containing protein 103 [Eublepharis macularius]|uniref:Coiled-coil domain-containing protein 103 n=1 Tax=Eublepharis macularius TaxID=481883 RepID=A0AA97K611_EUBMA|nr:coiled-coil domain-containing protein 103 [Eublepharis macularius]XP_054849592.1 coiled-coil domain-containing protein 103 [Eublepharis macularius]XP_054849593.1 coiled-coil domain-containing protein 103 [Eublepharis macularius]XP_054849594.1 coiled-coil domain-containing protein 103 [Eublepharis macularius]XP_054849595.1 coiled-coil domain-containing protein 103 [Eublepharis macularius]